MIHGDLRDVLLAANVAAGKVFTAFADVDEQATDYVIVLRNGKDPIQTLQGPTDLQHDTFVFQCWASGKAAAMAIAETVEAALEADTSLPLKYRETPADNEGFTPEVMELMEPVQYSIWHR